MTALVGGTVERTFSTVGDKGLDFGAWRRMRPAARISATSSRRSAAVMCGRIQRIAHSLLGSARRAGFSQEVQAVFAVARVAASHGAPV